MPDETERLLPVPMPSGPPRPIIHARRPENLEYPLTHQNGWLTPTERFFRRNHFDYPDVDRSTWRLVVTGRVRRTLNLSLHEIESLPRTSRWVTVECAGNKRALFEPRPEGEPWKGAAIGNAEWGGIPLSQLLTAAGPLDDTIEVLFVGADEGRHKETGERVHFARSLPLGAALHPDILVAYTMNGEPLQPQHGAPLRLVVPDWYGMASVKWLNRIELLDRPFQGPFQVRDYVYLPAPGAYAQAVPVTLQRVNSAIIYPPDAVDLRPGAVTVRGLAWGAQPVARVEFSLDDGETWSDAALLGPTQPTAWRLWQGKTQSLAPGTYTLLARATDKAGETQPFRAPWNAKGYGNNRVARVRFAVSLMSQRGRGRG